MHAAVYPILARGRWGAPRLEVSDGRIDGETAETLAPARFLEGG